MSSSSKSDITVAIVGGGLGGLCAAIALGRAGYSVHLFEQAPEFSEIGAGVGIGPNSFRALRMLGPDVADKYEKVADVDEDGAIWFRVMKWADGQHITDIHTKGRNSSVHRAHVLEALLTLMPESVQRHFSQHVVAAENLPSGRARLTITPSQQHQHPDWPGTTTTFDADAVIGCDGVKSAVRGSLGLGDGQDGPEDAAPAGGASGGGQRAAGSKAHGGGRVRYTGTYAYRGLLDMDAAVRENGEGARVPALWVAPGKHILSFPIEHGKILNLVAFVSDRSKDADERTWTGAWVKPVGKEEMFADFEDWDEKPRNLLSLIKKPERWALHELVPLDKWTVGRVTLLGDAAHASLPHNGAGAGQAIEDAYVLGQLLGSDGCTKETMPSFLQAYEDVRRPRASKQQVHSRESGECYEFASPAGDDLERLAAELHTRYDWIWTHDLTQDVESAKARLRSEGVLMGQ